MRIVAAALLAIGVLGLGPTATGAQPKAKRPVLGAPRVLYASDWSGHMEIYALIRPGRSPSGRSLTGPTPHASRR